MATWNWPLVLSLFLALPASGQDAADAVMGVPIGSSFELPSCTNKKRSVESPCYWEDDYFTKSNGLNMGPRKGYKISIPLNRMPPSLLASTSYIGVRNGRIVSLNTTTIGTSVQHEVLALLTEKYGPPSEQSSEAVRNGFGREERVISAIWKTPTLSVTFFGAISRFDEGQIRILTIGEEATAAAEKAARKVAEPKL